MGVPVPVDIKAHHRGVAAVHLAGSELMLRMAFQTGVIHEANVRGAFQEFSDRHGVAAMLLHAQGQRGHASCDQPGVERAQHAAEVDHRLLFDLVDQFRFAKHAAAQGIAVAVGVFRHAVDQQIGAQCQRMLENGGSKCAVDGKKSAGLVRNFCDRGDVADAGGGVARGFHMDQAGVRADGRLDGIQIRCIDKRNLNVVLFGQKLVEQVADGRIADLGADHVVAGFQEGDESSGQGGNAASQHHAVLRAFHGFQFILKGKLVAVSIARIDVCVDAAPVHGRAVGGQTVGVRHVDRVFDRADHVVRVIAGMNAKGHQL